jgi:hypothetical protein
MSGVRPARADRSGVDCGCPGGGEFFPLQATPPVRAAGIRLGRQRQSLGPMARWERIPDGAEAR